MAAAASGWGQGHYNGIPYESPRQPGESLPNYRIRQTERFRAALTVAGVSTNCFTEGAWVLRGYTSQSINEALSVFEYKTTEDIQNLFVIGVRGGVILGAGRVNTVELLNFCKWLKSKRGQDAVAKFMHSEKLRLRGKENFSVQEISLLSGFELCRNDWIHARKQLKATHDERMAALKLNAVCVMRSIFLSLSTNHLITSRGTSSAGRLIALSVKRRPVASGSLLSSRC
ncbi:unnamed protein product [Cuscuta europaea]|uniref:Uncharacterized protein n=1 Tax=Cuscuta europaea TaxID=41803 RepID=A0A9P0ZGI0_CUSEU|nr:unnamed protein product [Cuscuta europaea]